MLAPFETVLIGKWEQSGNGLVADGVCRRIEQLVAVHLIRVCDDSSGWQTLYQDPNDKRYWVLSYPGSEMHGGGPPVLVAVSPDEANAHFPLAAASNYSLQARRP